MFVRTTSNLLISKSTWNLNAAIRIFYIRIRNLANSSGSSSDFFEFDQQTHVSISNCSLENKSRDDESSWATSRSKPHEKAACLTNLDGGGRILRNLSIFCGGRRKIEHLKIQIPFCHLVGLEIKKIIQWWSFFLMPHIFRTSPNRPAKVQGCITYAMSCQKITALFGTLRYFKETYQNYWKPEYFLHLKANTSKLPTVCDDNVDGMSWPPCNICRLLPACQTFHL